MGAVETLLVWENLDCDRYEIMNPTTQKIEIKHLTLEQAKDTATHFKVWKRRVIRGVYIYM